MDKNNLDKTPKPNERIGEYLRRIRKAMRLTQEEVAQLGGIHKQTVIKIEARQSTRLSQKTRKGFVYALKIPETYLDALVQDLEIFPIAQNVKICPQCWKPGTQPEPQWLDLRAKYCFLCGEGLRDRCECGRAIADWHYAFCPFCGKGLNKNRQTIDKLLNL